VGGGGHVPDRAGSEDSEQEAAAAKSLLEKLGLYEELRGDKADPEGDVESEESQPEE
jgi:hypothetical protein